MAYDNNAFCWHGVISTDLDGAKAFYTEVLGWKIAEVDMGDDVATMFAAGGVNQAHLMAPPMPGVPSHVSNYLRVQDIDASTAACAAAGGAVVVPVTDIPVGQFSVVTSPSGATLSLFHEADEATAKNADGGDGTFHWVELHSTDLEADRAWAEAAFGFEVSEMPMPEGTYYVLSAGGAMRGGIMKGMHPGAPSMWLAWVEQSDVDATAERVKNNGGKLLTPLMDMDGIGRMAIAQAPDGAVFGVITPAKKG
jgi:uncharacterized protein